MRSSAADRHEPVEALVLAPSGRVARHFPPTASLVVVVLPTWDLQLLLFPLGLRA